MACSSTKNTIITAILFGVIGVFLTRFSPYSATYRKIPRVAFVGPLTRNTILDSAEKLFEGKMGFGPESIAFHKGLLYTGLADGSIIEIDGNKMRTVTKIGGNDCVTADQYPGEKNLCGHPLGLRFDKDGALVVADTVKGLYKVDIKTGAVNSLVDSKTIIDDHPSRFTDDLVIAKNGDIYFSDASFSATMETPFWQIMHKHTPDGRILHYDAKTKKVRVVLDKLYFPNGVELSPDEEFLMFSQTLEQNIKKFYLKGPKKGQMESFIDELPGMPDNIRVSGRGTYWVAIVLPKVQEEPALWDQLEFSRSLRYLVFSSLDLMKSTVDLARRFVPIDCLNSLSQILAYCHGRSIGPNYGLVLEFNINGEILRSLHSPKGHLVAISQAIEHQGTLYFGSPWLPTLGKLKLQEKV